MALNKEDKKDVSRAMGKAMANKISRVTADASRKYTATAVKNKMEDPAGFAVHRSKIKHGIKQFRKGIRD